MEGALHTDFSKYQTIFEVSKQTFQHFCNQKRNEFSPNLEIVAQKLGLPCPFEVLDVFEDGLRMGVLPGGCWDPRVAAPSLGSIPKPPGGANWSLGQCGCHRDPLVRPKSNSAEFRASMVLNHSCYVVLGLRGPQDPSLIPGSLELQLSGRRGFNPLGQRKNP